MSITLPKPKLIHLSGATTINLSDHNRGELQTDEEPIESKVRTADGTLRKYHTALKRRWSTSWDMLPGNSLHTVDGYAGAEDLETFRRANKGAITLKITKRDGTQESFTVMIEDFSKSVVKRWENADYYSVSITFEEV